MFTTMAESMHPVRYVAELHRWMPIHRAASGLAVMAYAGPDQLKDAWDQADDELRAGTSPWRDRDELEATLARIRERGYAMTSGQRVTGAVGIFAPVRTVATTTFHADEAQALVAGRVPVVAMLVGPGYLEMVHEIAGLPRGSRVGLVCASERGKDNILETLALSGTEGVEIVSALIEGEDELSVIDRTADIILLSREAQAVGLGARFSRPERIRSWTYEFDPSGLELLRRAIEHAATTRPTEPVTA